jgi:hypothetical protein
VFLDPLPGVRIELTGRQSPQLFGIGAAEGLLHENNFQGEAR